jgi:hypothetical protein
LFSYIAYGLGIRSALPLPELMAAESDPDVIVRLGKVNRLPSEVVTESSRFCFWATAEEAYFFWDNVGAFLVRGGCEIIIDPFPDVEERVLRFIILGWPLAVLLHQRGLLVLHASSVAVNGSAIAFLGGKGWGKSTTAAALHARGHGVVADDVVALDLSNPKSPVVFPSFPQIKLWPEAAASLGSVPDTLPRLHSRSEKRARYTTEGFSQNSLPLKRIYVLAKGTCQEIEPLLPQEAFMELVRQSYAVHLSEATGVNFLESTGATASHFRQCVSLTNCVPVCRLKRELSLPALPDLARLVEEDSVQNIY